MATVEPGSERARSSDNPDDLFPALWTCVCVGAIVGTFMAVLRQGEDSSHLQVVFSATLGAILGFFVGLSRTVWHYGRIIPLPASAVGADQLWDPWLDSKRALEDSQPQVDTTATLEEQHPETMDAIDISMVSPVSVRPHVISPETGDAIRLDDEIGRLIQDGRQRLIKIVGGPGSGKTTALHYLAAILPPWALARVKFIDDLQDDADLHALCSQSSQFVISAGHSSAPAAGCANYQISSWNQDDLIEYLLAVHADRCASVMTRLKAGGDRDFVQGIPELWTVVLDRMACDESIENVRSALFQVLEAWFEQHPDSRQITEDFCLFAIGKNSNQILNMPLSKLVGKTSSKEREATVLLRLVRHRPVGLLLASKRIASLVELGRPSTDLSRRFPHDLLQEAARLLTGNTLAVEHLNAWINRKDRNAMHPLAASLLHVLTPGWRPDPGCRPRLKGAHLAKAAWSSVNLTGVDLEAVNLNEADLSSANLEQSRASQAQLRRANLRQAMLDSCVAIGADLRDADLESIRAASANLQRANLERARLIDANLWKTDFRKANIKDADFSRANLEDAVFKGLQLNLARFDGARFGGADLRDCDLEEMVLKAPDFHDVDLRGALLTGSRMPKANFRGANLRGAGLAEIDWPEANLSDTDLRGASFHLGSSRSGLVGSPIACEGSRTGFYTDDYDDQNIKSVEEIRKANLRGADLRGAKIESVDFYLVDLRDAKYTRDQAKHLRDCRAILADRDN